MYPFLTHASLVAVLAALPAVHGCGDPSSPAADMGSPDDASGEVTEPSDVLADVSDPPDLIAEDAEEPDLPNPDLSHGDIGVDDTPVGDATGDTSRDGADDALEVLDMYEEVAEEDVTLRPACDPPLSSVGDLWARKREFEAVVTTGGTGNHRHTFIAAPSGAIINRLTGEYVSGDTTAVIDLVRTEDLGCEGAVETRIHVVPDLDIRPLSVSMPPGGTFSPAVSGGSGQWHLELLSGGTTAAELISTLPGQLELKRFRAGTVEGDESLAVVDDLTDEVVVIPVRVSLDGGPSFEPPWVWLPVGSSWPVHSTGGSGESLELVGAPTDSDVRIESDASGSRWVADDVGAGSVSDTDAFLGTAMTQHVRAIVGIGPTTIERNGRQNELWTALGPGDIDGDSFADAIIGAAEMTLSLPVSGGVFIWRGGPDGIAATPARTIAGLQRNEQFGAALANGDFDGDGLDDLVVGAPRFVTTAGIVGRALVYAGISNGLYSDAPVFGATGERTGDLFGHAVAACDFNGDGYDDLAVSSYDGEDVSGAPVAANQGAVYLFAGGPDGLGPVAVQTIFGRVPGGSTGFVASAELKFGRVMAAADFNGDGACDLAVSSFTPDTENGVVWAYRGLEDGPELIAPLPSRVWRGSRSGRMGHALAVGDLDRDGLPELVVAQPRWSKTTVQADNHGALRIMRGGDWIDGVATESLGDADFDATMLNPGLAAADTNDEYGFRLSIGDVTGDAYPDLVVGGIGDEAVCTGCVSGTGAIFVLAGLAGELPSSTPVGAMTSGVSADRVGSAVAVVGNIDASGQAAVLVAVGRDDTQGADLGRSYVFKPMLAVDVTGSLRIGLDMPSLTFGWRIGQSIDLIGDLDGDGLSEVVVGAPSASGASATGVRSIFSGLATVHRGTADGFEAQPFQTLSGFRRHSASDFWATEVAGMRDFDGDGRPDVALVARFEDSLTSYGAGTISTAACNVGRRDVGVVAVFGGKADGTLDSEPMLMHSGVQESQGLDVLTTADFNGDGLTDIIAGTASMDRPGASASDNAGGFEVVFGRTRPHATSTAIVCEADHRFLGFAAVDNMATALANLGDLDGDGCEEIAVGAPFGDLIGTNSGFVEIFFGAGSGCNSNDVRRLAISGTVTNAGVGAALDAADIDGDGLADLVIGSRTFRVGTLITGAAWVVTGATLAGLAPQAVARADNVVAVPVRLFGANAIASAAIAGSLQNELFGTGVALLAGHATSPLGPQPLVAVSSQASMIGDQPVAGIVRLYQIRTTSAGLVIAPRPVAVVAGEAHGSLPTARMRSLQLPAGAGRLLLVGASESSALAPFSGAVMLAPLDADVVEGWQ